MLPAMRLANHINVDRRPGYFVVPDRGRTTGGFIEILMSYKKMCGPSPIQTFFVNLAVSYLF